MKKLHVTLRARVLHVQVCELSDAPRARKLVSSSDGVFAIDVHRPEQSGRHWRVVGQHEFSLEDDADLLSARRLAHIAWSRLAEPDVAAVHVQRGATGYTFQPGGVWPTIPPTFVKVGAAPDAWEQTGVDFTAAPLT